MYTLSRFETLNVRFGQLTQLNISRKFLSTWPRKGDFFFASLSMNMRMLMYPQTYVFTLHLSPTITID